MRRGAKIVDLDGTLVRCNSFSRYVMRMVWHHPLIGVYVLVRKLRLISHARAKELIMSVHVDDAEVTAFVDELVGYVRRELLTDEATDEVVVLASAAPARYVGELAHRLGIPYYVATQPGCAENKGDVKLRNVMRLLEEHDLCIRSVITDHMDDLPLLEANRNGRNILVAPSRRTLDALQASGLVFSCHF